MTFPGGREVGVIHADEHLLAADKPSGLLMAPDRWDRARENLMGLIHAAVRDGAGWACERGIRYAANVHRLDAETSGVVLVALTRAALASLVRQFRGQEVKKTYLALVEGAPPQEAFQVDAPIGDDPRRPGRSAAMRRGKPARTDFRVLARFRRWAWVEARPHTGRQHQIRVHLKEAGCPIVCDRLYGSGKRLFLSDFKRGYRPGAEGERPLLARLGLHASALELAHPAHGGTLRLEAPLPKDLAVALKQLAKYGR